LSPGGQHKLRSHEYWAEGRKKFGRALARGVPQTQAITLRQALLRCQPIPRSTPWSSKRPSSGPSMPLTCSPTIAVGTARRTPPEGASVVEVVAWGAIGKEVDTQWWPRDKPSEIASHHGLRRKGGRRMIVLAKYLRCQSRFELAVLALPQDSDQLSSRATRWSCDSVRRDGKSLDRDRRTAPSGTAPRRSGDN
jgi:hypothetical protein